MELLANLGKVVATVFGKARIIGKLKRSMAAKSDRRGIVSGLAQKAN